MTCCYSESFVGILLFLLSLRNQFIFLSMRSTINLSISRFLLVPVLLLFSGNLVTAQINAFPYLENFEGFTLCGPNGCNVNCTGAVTNGWVQATNDQQDWRIDNNGTVSGSTGPSVDHTLGTAAGQYLFTEASSCTNQSHILLSPYFDLSSLSSPALEFWVHMAGGDMGTMTIEVAVGANGTWATLWSQSGAIQGASSDPWVKIAPSLATFAVDSVHFRLTGVTGNGFESDMAFDDFKISNIFPIDMGVTEVSQPAGLLFPTCSYTSSETISVVIENFGSDSVSNFPLAYRINGGTPVQETFAGTILSGATATYTFATPANLSTNGTYDIESYTLVSNDAFHGNDTATGNARNLLVSTYPYLQDFENLSLCTVGGGTQSCDLSAAGWVQGANGAEDNDDWRVNTGGTVSGDTGPDDDRTFGNGTGKYIYTEATSNPIQRSFAYSPCFQITGLSNPILAFFYHMYGSEMGTLVVEVTANGGGSWDTLWTQSGQVQMDESDPWELVTISLYAYNNQTISFRFNGLTGTTFRSDMALDDIYVGEDGLCYNPSLTIGQVDTTFAVLNLSSVNDTAATMIIEYGPAGFTPGTGTFVVTNSLNDTLLGLLDFTEYDVYVSEICGSGDTTTQVGPATFTTLCIPRSIGDSDSTAIVIGGLPFSDTSDTRCYTNQFASQTSNDVYYRLTTGPCTDSLFISTCSPLSQFDTYIFLLDSSGSVVASNDDAAAGTCGFTLNGGNRFSTINFDAASNTQYFIVVEGFGSSIGQFELTVDQSSRALELSTDLISNVACYGDSSGSISVSVSGGIGGYTYSWSNGDTIEDPSGLPAGIYTLTVTDSSGCPDSETYNITEPNPIGATSVVTNESVSGANDGSIDLTPSGGTPGYSYMWNTGAVTEDLVGLGGGIYCVTITDANGCNLAYCDTLGALVSVSIPNLNAFEVFPNPAPDRVKISVELAATADLELEVLNLMGQVRTSRKVEGIVRRDFTLDLTEYAQGTYLVRLRVDGQSVVKPLIISR